MTAESRDGEGGTEVKEVGTRDDAGAGPGGPRSGPVDAGSAASDRADRGTDRLSALFAAAVGSDLTFRLVVDLLLRFGPELGLAIRLADAPSTAPAAIVLTGTVLQFGAISWGIGWVALFVVSAAYVPRVVEPWDDAWPAGYLARLSLAVPFVAAGLLAEAAFRRALSTVVTVGRAPVPIPLEPVTVVGVVCGTALVFGALSLVRRPARHSRPGFVVRGILLVGIVGVFFAEISMLNPYAELFFLGLIAYDRLGGDSVLQEPAERIVDGASTVWGRPAEAVTAVYVTGAVAVVAFAVLAARIRAPADMLGASPVATAFLVLVGASALFYTYTFGERSLRQFRSRFDPSVAEPSRIEGFLLPSAVLTSLLLDGYVFGDPTGSVGVLQLLTGIVATGTTGWSVSLSGEAFTAEEGRTGFRVAGISNYHLAPVAVAMLIGLLGAVRPMEGLYLPTLLLSGELLRVDLVEALWRFGLLTATVVVPYVPVGAYTALTERTDSPAPAESPEPTTGGEATDRQVRVALQNAEGTEDPDPNPDEGDDDPDSKRSPGTVRGIGVAGCLWTAAVGVLVAVEAGVDVPSAGLVVAALLVASVVPVAALGSLSEAFGIGADGFQVVVEAILEAGIYAFVTVYLIWSGANSLVRWLIGNSS